MPNVCSLSSSSDSEDSGSDDSLGSSASSSSDQDSASSSSDQDSASSDSDQSSSSDDGKEEENRPSTFENVSEAHKGAEYVQFEVEDDSQKKWSLPFIYLQEILPFIPDKVLHEKILDKYPLPSSTSIKAPKLDDYVPEIFSATNASYGKSYDTNLHQIQGRIGAVMGPLCKIWLDLENIQSGRESADSLDPAKWLNVVETAITLLGQAFTSTTYHGRMNLLYNLTKDVKKAKKLLKSNSEDIATAEKLFGKKFYKAISKTSKIKKKSKEISKQLGSGFDKKKRRHDSSHSRDTHSSHPFRSEAPLRGSRGGGRISFRARRPTTKSPRGKSMSFTKQKSVATKHHVEPGQSIGNGKRGHTGSPRNGIKSRSYSRCSKKSAGHSIKNKLSRRTKTPIFSE